MATGFHGFHVIVGTIFLIVCLIRANSGDFTPRQHFGFEAAAWYWHFVDVVWLFLFTSIYVWGGWGAPVTRVTPAGRPAQSPAAAALAGTLPALRRAYTVQRLGAVRRPLPRLRARLFQPSMSATARRPS